MSTLFEIAAELARAERDATLLRQAAYDDYPVETLEPREPIESDRVRLAREYGVHPYGDPLTGK